MISVAGSVRSPALKCFFRARGYWPRSSIVCSVIMADGPLEGGRAVAHFICFVNDQVALLLMVTRFCRQGWHFPGIQFGDGTNVLRLFSVMRTSARSWVASVRTYIFWSVKVELWSINCWLKAT